MEKFKQKYSTKSARLENYNYSQNGLYFVTICTKDKEVLFGEVVDGEMVLNEAGKIADQFWQEIPKHFPFANLHGFVVMPNHLHAIIEIINPIESVETPRWGVSRTVAHPSGTEEDTRTIMGSKTPQRGVSTGKRRGYNPNWKPDSLGSIINQLKSACTKKIWKSCFTTFAWQLRFYDHIIHNDKSLDKIREHIVKNPEMWERDRNMPENVFV